MVGARDDLVGAWGDLAAALEIAAINDRLCSTEEGREAVGRYVEALAACDGDDVTAVRSMLEDDAGREALLLLGERWIEAEADLRGPAAKPPAELSPLEPEILGAEILGAELGNLAPLLPDPPLAGPGLGPGPELEPLPPLPERQQGPGPLDGLRKQSGWRM